MTTKKIEVLQRLSETYREAVELMGKVDKIDALKLISILKNNCEKAHRYTEELMKESNMKIVENETESLEKIVTSLMLQLGIPANVSGYQYIRKAILLVIQDEKLKKNVTKGLYLEIANKCDSTPSRVERAMRYAIETSFERIESFEIADKVFGNSRSKFKPTNTAYISAVVDYVLQNYEFA